MPIARAEPCEHSTIVPPCLIPLVTRPCIVTMGVLQPELLAFRAPNRTMAQGRSAVSRGMHSPSTRTVILARKTKLVICGVVQSARCTLVSPQNWTKGITESYYEHERRATPSSNKPTIAGRRSIPSEHCININHSYRFGFGFGFDLDVSGDWPELSRPRLRARPNRVRAFLLRTPRTMDMRDRAVTASNTTTARVTTTSQQVGGGAIHTACTLHRTHHVFAPSVESDLWPA